METGHGKKHRREIIDNNRKQLMVIAGKNCTVQNFTSNIKGPKDPFYDVKDYKSGNDFFFFGPEYAMTYIGNYTIRGIKYVSRGSLYCNLYRIICYLSITDQAVYINI